MVQERIETHSGTRTAVVRSVLAALGAVIVTAWSPLAHADLITNGGFETGDFSGWSAGSEVFIDTTFPNSGCCDAAFEASSSDPTANGTLSQSIATTVGESYTLNFYVVDEAGE